jgi:hypothetical protein
MSGAGSNRRAKRKPATLNTEAEGTRSKVIAALDESNNWSHVLELHYWSREPGMLDIMRALATMPEDTRAMIETFCAIVHEPAAVAADLDAAGRLTLTSPQIGRSLAIMQFCSDIDDPETPRRPN